VGSEGRSGGIGRRAERRRVQLNALIWRDVRVLKGSGDWKSSRGSRPAKLQRARSIESTLCRGEPVEVVEQKGRTGSGSGRRGSEVAGRELRSWNGGPGRGNRYRGAKGRYELPVPFRRSKSAACFEARVIFGRRGRKVRTPQSSVPDNVREGRFKPVRRKVPQKIYRPSRKAQVRVKRCGKSAPPAQ